MKPTKLLIPILTGSLFAVAANAQVEVTVTGSTAWRSITIDRTRNALFDPGSLGNSTTNDNTVGKITFRGTVSNAVPSLAATPVTVRLSFSGSAAGMLDVKNSALISTAEGPAGGLSGGTTLNVVPDLALSDVYPESASPPIDGGSFDQNIVGVVPFVYVRNNALTGITNITREQAVLLMTASGVQNFLNGMPASYLGGSSTNPVYMTGRDSGSGTRITVHKVIGFTGTPALWITNGISGTPILTNNAYSSGGLERAFIGSQTNGIGYLGLPDAAAIAGSATPISYDGITYSTNAVQQGSYSLWGYEHIVNRAGGMSANQVLVRDALIAAMTDPGFQSTNTLYNVGFVDQANMHVERGADGGTITSLDF